MAKIVNKFFDKIIILLVNLLLITVAGCIIYPQTASVPLIEKKGELQADGGVSLVPRINGTITYAPTNKIAIQVYGSALDNVYYYQGAIGYFWKNKNFTNFEIYGGFGYGYGDAYNDANPGKLKGNYGVYFVQLNTGKRNQEYAHSDYGIGLKTGLIDSRLNNENYYENYIGNRYVFDQTKLYHDYSLLFEPTIFSRIGGERLKFNLKLSGCWVKKLTHTDKSLPFMYINMGLSVYYLIE